MAYSYDNSNIFAKILRGEIPCGKVLETEHSLAFNDIAPKAPVHVLVIPKGSYVNFDHFAAEASDAELADFSRAVGEICRSTGVAEHSGGNGYRLISNSGSDGVQVVPHMHVHVIGGCLLGSFVQPAGESQ
ncbi:MAG: histidine triad nucleotide-binding protein [Rhodobacteraceae bacterium]|nr:histidine triad nucleotide-binding protein [Paracoccaceae bacterium]